MSDPERDYEEYDAERAAAWPQELKEIEATLKPRLCGKSGKDICEDCVGSCGVEDA